MNQMLNNPPYTQPFVNNDQTNRTKNILNKLQQEFSGLNITQGYKAQNNRRENSVWGPLNNMDMGYGNKDTQIDRGYNKRSMSVFTSNKLYGCFY